MRMRMPIKNQPKEKPADVVQESDDEPPDLAASNRQPNPAVRPGKPGRVVKFPSARTGAFNPAAKALKNRFFPNIPLKLWNNWQWQVSNRIRTSLQLERFISLSDNERTALSDPDFRLPLGITPYYMSLISPNDPDQPIRRSVVPTCGELVRMPEEADDPLGEEAQSPVHGLVHRYPDRALLLLSDFCSTYCRYCTRSRVVGHGTLYPSRSRLEQAFHYLENTPAIRDVLLSGGDPLLLGDNRLAWILSRLRQIPHIEIIRIGTKVPAVLPQRITPQLVKMLRKYHPLWMSLHFIHPDECTPEAYRACGMLADAGIPLGSQTVLLKGINDRIEPMRDLMHRLMKMRVRPYYLYQCDPISGSSHFRTSVGKGLEIIRGLRGFTSGYAVPTYVVDAPGGGGKIPLMPDYTAGRDGDFLLLKNYADGIYRCHDAVEADAV